MPLNAVFGVVAALALVRGRAPGKRLLDTLIDLPFAISPVVIGLSLLLVYGRTGWFGPWLTEHGIQIIFSLPGIVLATIFVSLPFVAREVAPVLAGDRRRAGAGGGDARRLGLADVLARHAALDPLGPRVRDRALDRASDRRVRRGQRRLRHASPGETETLTLLVEKRFGNFDLAGAYAASALLAVIALSTLLLMSLIGARRSES